MNYYIAIEDSNWADEFDLQGMKLIKSNKTLPEVKKQLFDEIEEEYGDEEEEEKYPLSFGFGTNEAVEIGSRKDLEGAINLKKLSEEEYKVIKKILGEEFGLSAIL